MIESCGRNFRTGLCAAVLMWSALCLGGAARADVTFWVSTDGSDSNAGTRAEPFASVPRAQEAVRSLRERGELDEPVTIHVRPETYRLERPLTFGPQDSGTPDAPVTYRAAGAGDVVLSGGILIHGWEKSGKLWQARVPEVERGELYFHQLFVNGRRAPRAATPNRFYLRTAGPIKPLGDRRQARRDPSTKRGFRYREGDFRRWDNLDDVTIELYHSWTSSLHWIDELDTDKRIVRFTNRCSWPVGYWEKFERYRIENYREALDSPGEWYLDRDDGTLYYWPRKGEDMREAVVVAPVLRQLVRIEGRPEEGEFVEHLTLKGLSFRHADWQFDRSEMVDGQAHARRQRAAITAYGLRDSVIEGCEVAHVGSHAVRLDEGCRNNRIARCHVHDCGGGGIYVGPDAKVGYMPPDDALKVQRNEIVKNFIHHTSRVLGGSIGIWVGSSSFNTIRHNEISDFDYTGISVGWCWSRDTDIFQRGNRIEYNHIHHSREDLLSDNGGIYVLGYSPGSVIRGNVIHHVYHYPYINDSRGIYLDGNTSEYVVENNLVHDIGSFGVTLKGQHNRVRNNIFAFCGGSGFNRLFKAHARDFEYDRSFLERNIVVQREGAMTTGYYAPRWTGIDHNLYYALGDAAVAFNDRSSRILDEAPEVHGVSFERWRELGRDRHSMVAAPKFADLDGRDFRLGEDSPARKLGFQPFDYGKAGLRGDPQWTSLPDGIERQPLEFAPPPPKEKISYGFEGYEAGDAPVVAGRFHEAGPCRIRVTDRVAAEGRRSLKFTDGPADRGWIPHWSVRFEEKERGRVRFSCRFRNDAQKPGRFRFEFRDWTRSDYRSGPMVDVEPDGTVRAGGRKVAEVPPGTWNRLLVRFRYGSDAPTDFTLTLRQADGTTSTLLDLPFSSKGFETCTWFGVSGLGNEEGAWYLDEVELDIRGEARESE